MSDTEIVIPTLYGQYHDILTGPDGRVLWDSGWCKNTIVRDCRLLLATFMHGGGGAQGIQGLQVGAGLPAWDTPPGPPPGNPAQVSLVDPNPFTVPPASLQIEYVDETTGAISPTPTSRIQIKATLGPGVPPWPDGTHSTATLREFGLVARLGANNVLVNYVTHAAIPKDPVSTLNRIIWLVF